jgi:hypothetical protein
MLNIVLLVFLQIPTVDLPLKVTGQIGAFITIPARTEAKSVKWVSIDKGLNIFPVELLKDSKTLIVTAQSEGSYRVFAYAGNEFGASDPAFTTVLIGENPEPIPVNPTDSDITKAASKEDKEKVKWLSMFYSQLSTDIQKPEYETLGSVFKTAKSMMDAKFQPDELVLLRIVIGKRLNEKLPKDAELKLTQDVKDLLTSTFLQIAKELK